MGSAILPGPFCLRCVFWIWCFFGLLRFLGDSIKHIIKSNIAFWVEYLFRTIQRLVCGLYPLSSDPQEALFIETFFRFVTLPAEIFPKSLLISTRHCFPSC